MTRPWIKLHTTKLDDVRILRLNERQQLRYFQLYLLAGRLNADGLFIENDERLSDADIAIKLRINDLKQFSADMKALKQARLIKVNGHGPFIEDFAREQVDWSRKQEQDRERQSRHRNASVTRDNDVTKEPSRKGHAPRPDQKKIKKEKKKEIKKTTTPTPPQRERKAAPKVGGGKGQSSSSAGENKNAWMNELESDARATAEIITPIMFLCGLGQKKIETHLPKVATRIKPPEAKRYTLAALASAFADDSVKQPAQVAAYRMANDSVPVQFMNSDTWRVIPANILSALDVDIDRLPRSTNNTNNDVIRKVAANVAR